MATCACMSANISTCMCTNVSSLPRRLLRIMSGDTGLSFLSALMSSSSRSWRLRGRTGWGFSLRAATWHGNHTSEPFYFIPPQRRECFLIASSHLKIWLLTYVRFISLDQTLCSVIHDKSCGTYCDYQCAQITELFSQPDWTWMIINMSVIL